eukprot:TRINITY_DN13103_c0_g1_i1.p1 TRINITY_DN13103_c0_g1~~TRINITY_DN13103_c0_g1_i1.p1  ORF type:complete len:295 (-),score=66.21 TRINITY_DN13103_c0_g1_i1:134-1018(-)
MLSDIMPSNNFMTYLLGGFVGIFALVFLRRKLPMKIRFFLDVLFFGYISCAVTWPIFLFDRIFGKKRFKCPSFSWGELNNWWFNISYEKIGDGKLYDKRVMYVLPHRSWADFPVHRHICQQRAAHLARLLVGFIFPTFIYMTYIHSTIFWINRNNSKKETLYPFLKKMYDNAPVTTGLINYAEGTRNLKNTPRSLKRGVIYFAYIHDIPIQIIMCSGCDDIINEKKFTTKYDQLIRYCYGPVVHPADFDDKEAFFQDVKSKFEELFAEFYPSDEQKIIEIPQIEEKKNLIESKF